MEYEHRIVCFIDILGFKNIIAKTINSDNDDVEHEIEKINKLFLLAREILNIDKENRISKTKVITQFSDSIVISFVVDERSEVFFTLLEILHLIINFIYEGILVRGGIAYGKLIHTDKILFGPGLNAAYETESKAALYPRVILDKTVVEIGKRFHAEGSNSTYEEESIMNIITKDTDDMYYIDYIHKAQSELDEPDLDMPEYIERLRQIIKSNQNIDSPDIKVKTGWLINKFNNLIESATNEAFIERLRRTESYELVDYYSNLEKIE
ncbi:MAG: hypothetical protein Q8928_13865 [Bacteroidota bacterium]|nr:hypothetical protein [Bacteroidota bacterium]